MPDTAIHLPFAGGEYRFWLPMPQVVDLERACGKVAAFEIYNSLLTAKAAALHVRETILAGLIGGAAGIVDGSEVHVGPSRARWLIDHHVYPERPLAEGLQLAAAIMHATVSGITLPPSNTSRKGGTPPFVKGQVIYNCGAMHLDWERLSLSGYLEALHANNAAHSSTGANSQVQGDPDRLSRFVDAHRGEPSDWLRNAVKTWSADERAGKLASVVSARGG